MTIASEVLEIARFAPSGDNSQPWRFVLRSASDVDVYGYDTREHCVYDLDGWASELSHGALLETIAIAATQVGARASIELPTDAGRPRRYVVRLAADASVRPDPLANVIIRRTVQRDPRGTRTSRKAVPDLLVRKRTRAQAHCGNQRRQRANSAHHP